MRLSYLLLGLCSFIIFALKLGYLPLLFEEPRRALVSLEMILSGNYVIPRINGFEYYNKPPLYNWILIAFFKLFGTDEWVVRLPTYLGLFFITGINYNYFKTRIGVESTLLSSFFFLLSGHVLFYFSFIGEIDITYSLIVFCQALVFLHFHEKEKPWLMFASSYALMTIGFLTKGMPSIAFQGLTIIGFAVYYKRWIYLVHPANFIFLLGSLGCLFGYFHVYAEYSDPLPYIAQLINESSKRTSLDLVSVLINPLKIFVEFLKITFPWCLMAIPILWRRNRKIEANKWISFGLLFVIANSWLYFLSPGTRDRYLYMFLPFIYNALAFYLIPLWPKKQQSFKIGTYAFALLLTALFFYLSVDLAAAIWLPILSFIGFGSVVWALYKNKLTPVFSLFALMLIARLSYDVIVFPDRKQNLKEVSAKVVSSKIIDIIGDNRLFFYTPFSSKPNALPILGSVDIAKIDRLPYDLSFYVSQAIDKPILATDELISGEWYVARSDGMNQSPKLAFTLEKRVWILFKKE